MRFTLFVSALALTALPATAVFAQDQAARSPSEFVCELVGDDCADDAATAPEQAAPATAAPAGRAARVSGKARGFALAQPVDPAATARSANNGTAKVTRTPRALNGGAGITMPAVDLRLGFTSGASTLVGRELAEVKNFAMALRSPKLAGRRIRIEGHTDSVGSRTSNLLLSKARADAVRQTLISEGVDPSRIEAVGYGFDRPLPGRAASAGSNRRVEAVLVK